MPQVMPLAIPQTHASFYPHRPKGPPKRFFFSFSENGKFPLVERLPGEINGPVDWPRKRSARKLSIKRIVCKLVNGGKIVKDAVLLTGVGEKA